MAKPNTSFAEIETNHVEITLSLDELIRAGAQRMLEADLEYMQYFVICGRFDLCCRQKPPKKDE